MQTIAVPRVLVIDAMSKQTSTGVRPAARPIAPKDGSLSRLIHSIPEHATCRVNISPRLSFVYSHWYSLA